jgi:multiple sugar transport system permease protein
MTAIPLRRSKNARRIARTGWLFFLPFVIIFLVAIIAPLAYALYLSLFKEQIIGGTTFAWFGNYLRAFTDPQLLQGLGTVLGFMAIQIPVILLVSLGSALALDSRRVRGMPFFRLAIFLPYAIPGVVAALMWGYIYGNKFGLIGQLATALHSPAPNLLSAHWMLFALANISVWSYTGYNMLIFYSALQGIPEEIYEAAKLDGAGEFRKAWSIKLPAIRPAVGLALFFSVIGGIQLFTEPSVLQSLAPTVISSGYTPNLYMFNLAIRGNEYDYSAAVAITLGAATILLVVIVQLVMKRFSKAEK